MEAFQFISSAVPLPIENIDTDQIIPARFLKLVVKSGFGENLFRDWRYYKDGSENENFVLNNSTYSGRILIAGKNFGCGSSREHAAWAIKQFGFDVVISSEFADIFKNNALNNAILPIEVSSDFLHACFEAIESDPKTEFGIDLNAQLVSIPSDDMTFEFDINPFKKECLLKGMDELDYLLSLGDEISKFEKAQTIY
jgi:3-isopropylmalate/(R)-2-methylmalate dehydratase small subunit